MKQFIAIAAVTIIFFSSCKLKRSSIPSEFPGRVSPSVICPGQNISVEWDILAINEKCKGNAAACKRDPLTVEVMGSGGINFKESPTALRGSHNGVATGTEDITISLHAFDTDQDLGTSTLKVNVLAPGEVLTFDASCEGSCENGKAVWKDMAVDFKGNTLSDVIAIKRITNKQVNDIIVSVFYQNGETATINLKPGQTSSDFTSRVSRIAAKLKEVNVQGCTSGTTPPSIQLNVAFGCL